MAIIGNIKKIEKLLKSKDLGYVFDYLHSALNIDGDVYKRVTSLPVGSFVKQDIGGGLFAMEQSFNTKDRSTCFFESHKEYIDFQLIILGNEVIEYSDIDKLEIEDEYNAQTDFIKYKTIDDTTKILLTSDDMAIFLPDDAHMCLGKYKDSETVYKTVLKLPIDMWVD